MDQSDENELEALLPLSDPRLRYHHSRLRGLSLGRNEGISFCRYPFIVCTDDDCIVPASWLSVAASLLQEEPRLGLVFGNVVAAAHDRETQVIPTHLHRKVSWARTLWEKNRVEGMGACMAMRREAWLKAGGFDPALGAGTPLSAGEELDLAMRVLRAGFWLQGTPTLTVEHYGILSIPQALQAVSRYWRGTGAAFGKNLRLAPLEVAYVMTQLAVRFCFYPSESAKSLRAPVSRRLAAFVEGWMAGIVSPKLALHLADPA